MIWKILLVGIGGYFMWSIGCFECIIPINNIVGPIEQENLAQLMIKVGEAIYNGPKILTYEEVYDMIKVATEGNIEIDAEIYNKNILMFKQVAKDIKDFNDIN